MVATRRSGTSTASPQQDGNAAAGSKRKEHATSPASKHEPKVPKKQTTIEESIGDAKPQLGEDSEMKDDSKQEQAQDMNDETRGHGDAQESSEKESGNGDKQDIAKTEDEEEGKNETHDDGAIQESSQREKRLPSNILEKGVIYFFARNRVGIEDADSVGDLARTYFVLRPLPLGAKLSDGAIPDSNTNRLFALPKKVFPKSHNDRFMAFVEKANATIQDLKENFLQGTEYETKTAGTRQVQPVTPVAEGVYAITRTEDRTTHLVYSTTIPSELGEVQNDLGIRDQGSFVVSVKNPERSGPANASLPQKPDWPKEFIDEFRGLAWSEIKPKYIDYANVQILLIGENTETGTQPTTKDQKHDKEEPKEEIEQLEHEDELRVEHLNGDDSVFDDLKMSKNEYPKVPSTW